MQNTAQLHDFNKIYLAAQVLGENHLDDKARGLLELLWQDPYLSHSKRFKVLAAKVELHARSSKVKVLQLLLSLVNNEPGYTRYWKSLEADQQAAIFEWLGELQFSDGDSGSAQESFSRAASMGRDTSILWRCLAELHIDQEDLQNAIRYLQRSLDLFRQLELGVLATTTYSLGSFGGHSPSQINCDLDSFLPLLLKMTKLAKNQKNLNKVRNLLDEMIHQYPENTRLLKIKSLLDSVCVEHNLEAVRSYNNQADISQ